MIHGTSVREESGESGYDVRDTCVRARLSVCPLSGEPVAQRGAHEYIYDNDNRYVVLYVVGSGAAAHYVLEQASQLPTKWCLVCLFSTLVVTAAIQQEEETRRLSRRLRRAG